MSKDLEVPIVRRRGSRFLNMPWCLLIIAYMVTVHLLGATLAGATAYAFLGLCLFVLFVKFFKSGDIGARGFLIELAASVASLVLATVLLSYMRFGLGQRLSFFDWFGYAVLLGNAVLSPFNAFRTALRNIGLSG
jgi:hypothetical protein